MDSMNRFCDDMIEDILFHLSFEDKIKYECVCRQWKRCLFERQSVLVIDGNENSGETQSSHSLNQLVVKTKVDNAPNRVSVMRKTSFVAVLKKCPAIRKLVISGCECDNEILQLIGDNCPFLDDIECELVRINPTENCILELGHKLGKRLKRFRFVYFTIDCEIAKGFLYSCSKLESINCDILAAVADRRPDFLPLLNNLRVRVRPSDEKQFEIIGEKYSKMDSLRSLTLYGNSFCIPSAMKHISCITSLESLTIDLSIDRSADLFVPNMLLIAEKLKNLKALVINSMVFIGQQFFKSLGHFKNLSKLSVTQNLFYTKSNANINISDLSGCNSLKHLSIMGFNMNELFFDDISLYLPQLKSIKFSLMTDNLITDHLFHTFAALEELQKFSFKLMVNKAKRVDNSSFQTVIGQLSVITDNGLSHMISTCPKLKNIELTHIFTSIVGQNTLNAITTKAKSNPKLTFILNISGDQIFQECGVSTNVELDQMPDNLLIKLYSRAEKSCTCMYSSDFLE